MRFVDIARNLTTLHIIRSAIRTTPPYISDETIKRPSSEFKGGSVAEDVAILKQPPGTTNIATA